jgi:hypothetical protein
VVLAETTALPALEDLARTFGESPQSLLL